MHDSLIWNSQGNLTHLFDKAQESIKENKDEQFVKSFINFINHPEKMSHSIRASFFSHTDKIIDIFGLTFKQNTETLISQIGKPTLDNPV